MRKLASCVVLSFFWLGLGSSGWAQREVPPPTDLPLEMRPATSSSGPVQDAASQATVPQTGAPSAPVAAKTTEKKTAKTAQVKKPGPAPANGSKHRLVQTEPRQSRRLAKTAKKPDPSRTAPKNPAAIKVTKEKAKASSLAKKNPAKKVHRAGMIPGE